MRFILLTGCLLSMVPGAFGSPSQVVIDYLGAIDSPITSERLVHIGAKTEELWSVVLDDERPLYLRGRALAAYAQIADFRSLELLSASAGSTLPRPLRRQAIISLAEVFGPIAPAYVRTILIELIPAMPWCESTLSMKLERLSQAVERDGSSSD